MPTNSSISKGVYHVHLNAAKVSSCPPVITLFWWRSSVLVNTIIPHDLKAARDKESSRAKQQEGGSVARNNGPLCSGRKWSPLRGDEGAPVTPAADGSISATGTCLGFSAQLGLHLCANVCVWQPHRWANLPAYYLGWWLVEKSSTPLYLSPSLLPKRHMPLFQTRALCLSFPTDIINSRYSLASHYRIAYYGNVTVFIAVFSGQNSVLSLFLSLRGARRGTDDRHSKRKAMTTGRLCPDDTKKNRQLTQGWRDVGLFRKSKRLFVLHPDEIWRA